ncbi:MAG: hypothetical protein ACLP7F_05900, partial [Acidimicrobiales bacterium]
SPHASSAECVTGSRRSGRVTTRKTGPEVIEPVSVSSARSEVIDDEQCERIAANTGEVFTEQVGGSTVIAGSRGADHFDVMTFPVHLATADDAGGPFGEGLEIGDCEPERRIGRDRITERRYRLGRVRSLLRLAIEGGGLDACRDRPTVVLDRGTSSGGRLGPAGIGPF